MKRVALSFSGGKDSCFALYYLMRKKLEVVSLFTTVWKEKQETVAHGERLMRIEEQAEQLGIPVTFIETDFESYQEDFVNKLKELKKNHNIDTVAFGDIYIKGHREWGEGVAEEAGLAAYYPLWTKQENITGMLRDFVHTGFKAEVIKVDEEKLPATWVGCILDESFIEDILQYNDVCPMGESGEYHTFVYDGPIFNNPIRE
ncbi:MAG TPA: diphthine--ammonia ligase [Pseudogracilibacillus sp.]|nr:diphthine--ammonia ligase [Pseudogracilibacillus sp.]